MVIHSITVHSITKIPGYSLPPQLYFDFLWFCQQVTKYMKILRLLWCCGVSLDMDPPWYKYSYQITTIHSGSISIIALFWWRLFREELFIIGKIIHGLILSLIDNWREACLSINGSLSSLTSLLLSYSGSIFFCAIFDQILYTKNRFYLVHANPRFILLWCVFMHI